MALERGEIVAILGPSGAGKTTLFKLISGLLEPEAGTITIDGATDRRDLISYLMQEDLLLSWRSALDNVLLAAELGRNAAKPDTARALELVNEVGLNGYEHARPSELSGGMRQRVALARALLQDKPILLLDEPFGALDVARRQQMYELVRKIHDKHSKTTLLITHDFRDALILADRILLLADGTIAEEWHVPRSVRTDPKELCEWQEQLRAKTIMRL